MCSAKLENLIDIKSLSTEEISAIADRALEIKCGAKPLSCKEKHAAMIFFENSTRTYFSFEMALNKLGASVYNFETSKSSLSKGEDFFDTVNNLAAIGFDACIIRTSEEGLIKRTIEENQNGRKFFKKIALINAGEGSSAHPTQALLDFVTIKEKFSDLNGLNLVIVGDIRHSRVAKSNIELLNRFGVKIKCVAPKYFMDETIKNVEWCDNMDEAFENADIVMALRIQKERIQGIVEFEDYIKNYRITEKNLPKNAILMHPGPVNRDIEVTSGLLDSKRGETIMTQAHNGVFTRIAILEMIFQSQNGGANV